MAEFDARSLLSFQARELGTRKVRKKHLSLKRRKNQRRRKKRRKNLLQMISPWNQRRKILWMPYQRELSIWRNGKDFTPTMTRILPLPGSGSTLTTRTTPSGEGTTSTMTS